MKLNPFLDGDPVTRSLNRAVLAALPGIRVPAGLVGKTGFQLLSAETLRKEIAAAAPALGLDPSSPDLLPEFDERLGESSPNPAGVRIARAYGERLGYFLLMLHRGDAPNRAARPEWGEAHWAFWARVKRVVVGGGLMSGHLGHFAVENARAVLDSYRASLTLDLSPYAGHLPLVGLARTAPPDATQALLFDFGQTSCKRGLATYVGGALDRLEVWPSAKSVCPELLKSEHSLQQLRERLDRMEEIIVTSWAQVAPPTCRTTALGVSISCYLYRGHPAPGDLGCYGVLGRLAPNLEMFMRAELAARLDMPIRFYLMHDGAAAATAYAGDTDCVVLTLGTAIGNGFPPPAKDVRPLHPQFSTRIQA